MATYTESQIWNDVKAVGPFQYVRNTIGSAEFGTEESNIYFAIEKGNAMLCAFYVFCKIHDIALVLPDGCSFSTIADAGKALAEICNRDIVQGL